MSSAVIARRTTTKLGVAVAPVVEFLEGRCLLAVQPLPVALSFSSAVSGTLGDKDGQGTGFAYVQANKLGTQHQPSLIDLDTSSGTLKLTTSGTATSGSSYGTDNTLINALGTEFDAAAGVVHIVTRLVGPLSVIDRPHEQAGVYFGPDQDNWVKVVAIATPNGQRIQFADEQRGADGVIRHTVQTNLDIGSFSSITTLDLRLIANPSTGNVLASYRVNNGAWKDVLPKLTLSGDRHSAFFNATAGRAGLIAMHKNDVAPLTATFDSFSITRTSTTTTPTAPQPEIVAVSPGNGATGVVRDVFIGADLKLVVDGKGVDARTLNASTVKLYRSNDLAPVSATRNTSGSADDLVLVPQELLDANTNYTFEVTSGLKDLAGNAFKPFVSTFTTGIAGGTTNPDIAFQKVTLSTAQDARFTGVVMGPDGRLYASTHEGKIHRWSINADGTLGAAQVIHTLTDAIGRNRLITGITFDPASTANNLLLWVSHGYYAGPTIDGEFAPEWSGRLTRLSGANLETAQDYLSNLPRSVSDHLNNQPVFGPDGKLYLGMSSNSSFGAPDSTWGNRPEQLLSASILQIDTAAIAQRIASGQGPLSVRTWDGGTYNPYAANAPVKIYASGLRNAFDLLWHSNGNMYAPVNGSNAGGNTPAGAGAPALTNLGYTESDWLFKVASGKYHGHPNPLRNEFVLNGGNPTSGADPFEIRQYPVGTNPPTNYNRPIYSFGAKYSPNGIIEYKGGAFGGKLQGRLLVARYSGGDDIFAMTLDANGNVASVDSGIAGLDKLIDPLDLIEDRRAGATNGNLYVVEYGGSKISLLRPIGPGARAEVSHTTAYFSDIVNGSITGPTQEIILRNTGSTALGVPSNAYMISGADAGMFVLKSKPTGNIEAGGSFAIGIAFNPASGVDVNTVRTAVLNIQTSAGLLKVNLRGQPTAGEGGQNEPSLQEVVNLYGYKTNVGDNDPKTTVYPSSPVTADQVDLQRMLKAGAGPVSIDVLGVYGVGSNPALRFGWYYGGSFADKHELFTVPTSQAQTVQVLPQGDTSFDPGSGSFSLYSNWPNFDGGKRVAYSEDRLNTWDNGKRKYRFFKLRDGAGNIVPNAYVFAVEEWDQASADRFGQSAFAYDSNDIIGIIRNVKPAPAGPEIGLQNLDGVPFGDRLVFNKIGLKDADTPNVAHDKASFRIHNTGSSTLNVSSITASSGWSWTRAGGTGGAFALAAGASETVTVTFTATSGTFHNGTLTINSNDLDEAAKRIQLAGHYQVQSENDKEPNLQQIIDLFGYKTRVLYTGQSFNADPGRVQALGDEVLSKFWVRSSASGPVTVRQLAAYHTVDPETSANFAYRPKATGTYTLLFEHQQHDSQSLLPRKLNSSTPAYDEFSPSGAFEVQLDGERSDDTKNPQEKTGGNYGHHVRFYPAKDRNGVVIPDTYLVVMDYNGINYDYNDNVYLMTNVRPEGAPFQPQAVAANVFSAGTEIRWKGNSETDLLGYNVYRATSPSGPFAKLTGSPTTAAKFFDTGAAVGTMYYYRVAAVDSQGYESTWSYISKKR